jgi:hypothetical protein
VIQYAGGKVIHRKGVHSTTTSCSDSKLDPFFRP